MPTFPAQFFALNAKAMPHIWASKVMLFYTLKTQEHSLIYSHYPHLICQILSELCGPENLLQQLLNFEQNYLLEQNEYMTLFCGFVATMKIIGISQSIIQSLRNGLLYLSSLTFLTVWVIYPIMSWNRLQEQVLPLKTSMTPN